MNYQIIVKETKKYICLFKLVIIYNCYNWQNVIGAPDMQIDFSAL